LSGECQCVPYPRQSVDYCGQAVAHRRQAPGRIGARLGADIQYLEAQKAGQQFCRRLFLQRPHGLNAASCVFAAALPHVERLRPHPGNCFSDCTVSARESGSGMCKSGRSWARPMVRFPSRSAIGTAGDYRACKEYRVRKERPAPLRIKKRATGSAALRLTKFNI
jgi:hypothetical protein